MYACFLLFQCQTKTAWEIVEDLERLQISLNSNREIAETWECPYLLVLCLLLMHALQTTVRHPFYIK